ETVLTRGPEAVRRYLAECRDLGFDVVEVSAGFVTVPPDDFARLVGAVAATGLKAKAEGGGQVGAGGGDGGRGAGGRGHPGRRVGDRPGPAVPGRRGRVGHAGVGRDHGERGRLADGRGGPGGGRPGAGPGNVRGGRPGGVRVVRQDI